MNWLKKLFQPNRQTKPANQPMAAPSSKPAPQQPKTPARGSWSSRVEVALSRASQNDRAAIPLLVDLLFENTIPVTPPTLADADVGLLLKHPQYAPPHELAAVRAAVDYQNWMRDCSGLVARIKETVENFPNCTIRGEVLDQMIQAAGFSIDITLDSSLHSHAVGAAVPHLNLSAGTKGSASAVAALCSNRTPVTSNILHKVAEKKNISMRTGGCTYFSEHIIDFSGERQMANEELEKRGKPPYDPKAYLAA